MNRLVVRLVISHVLVALLGAVATFLVVRQLAPTLFDRSMMGQQMGMGQTGMGQAGMGQPGMGQGASLRAQFAQAVDQALLVGAAVGALAAAAFGVVATWRLTRPLESIRAATRELAAGRYDAAVPLPHEQELAALAEDINLLGDSLQQTETRRVRLLGEVAHEMRTPLTVIDATVEGMIDGLVAPTPEQLGRVSDEVRRLRRLSDDLSALSRAEEGRLELRLQQVDLRAVVATAADRLRPQAEDAGVTLRVDGGAAALPADADPDRIGQVVTNLVGNALAATPPGGSITVTCRREPDAAVVAVADTGEGLREEDLDRVFERFYRGPGRSRSTSGNGVGLTIARSIVRGHGGELMAASPGPGQGATFTVRLPLARQ
ncbi:MAG: HAMP domain-containing sensor histidine kinase [Nocardioidaceae bacterium]